MQTEVKRLETEREAVVLRLTAAREQGDLSENGAYHAAKFELGNIGRQLRQLRFLLHNGVITTKRAGGRVSFGNTVKLKQEQKEVSYTLVSQYESDPRNHMISTESPLGQLLMGKTVGDSVTLQAPVGQIVYKIIEVS